jgi:hypothetical protein
LVLDQGKARAARAAPDWLEGRAAFQWFSSRAQTYRSGSTLCLRFIDDQEIGPGMLMKVAKHTGLSPDDL